jgi:hypothetical protein
LGAMKWVGGGGGVWMGRGGGGSAMQCYVRDVLLWHKGAFFQDEAGVQRGFCPCFVWGGWLGLWLAVGCDV